MKRAKYEKIVTIDGIYRLDKIEERFGNEYFKTIKEIASKIDNGEFVGMAIGAFFGDPVFKIEDKLYLLWNFSVKGESTEFYFVMPYDFKFWQSESEFIDGLLD